MRSTQETLIRDVAVVCLAVGLVGVSFGAIAVGEGLPVWLPMLMSVVVFAGASQFMFVGIVAAGGNPFAAALAGLLVNARHLPFGFAVGDLLQTWRERLLGSHFVIDESVAFVLAQEDWRLRRRAFWLCGIGLFGMWNLGVLVGTVGGTAVTDTDALGLDAAFPAVTLALVLPALADRATRTAALLGAVIAVAATPFLTAGVPILLALVAVWVAVR